jgi:hypothetical protein
MTDATPQQNPLTVYTKSLTAPRLMPESLAQLSLRRWQRRYADAHVLQVVPAQDRGPHDQDRIQRNAHHAVGDRGKGSGSV